MLVLRVAVLAELPVRLRQWSLRWWLVAGLGVGLLAAGCWLWTMGASGHDSDARTWIAWLVMLAGPLVLGSYYVVALLRGNGGAA